MVVDYRAETAWLDSILQPGQQHPEGAQGEEEPRQGSPGHGTPLSLANGYAIDARCVELGGGKVVP